MREPPEEDAVAQHNSDRLALLARKYVAKEFSDEERARLEILSERVRQLLPPATPEAYGNLADVLERVKSIRETDRQIRESVGITWPKA